MKLKSKTYYPSNLKNNVFLITEVIFSNLMFCQLFLVCVESRLHEPSPKIDGDRQRHTRPRATLRQGLRPQPLTPSVGTLSGGNGGRFILPWTQATQMALTIRDDVMARSSTEARMPSYRSAVMAALEKKTVPLLPREMRSCGQLGAWAGRSGRSGPAITSEAASRLEVLPDLCTGSGAF